MFASKYFTLFYIYFFTHCISFTDSIGRSGKRCENVFDLDLYGCDVVYGCDVANIVILYGFACLNECVDLDVNMNVLYIM
jgi:hypothetical protein